MPAMPIEDQRRDSKREEAHFGQLARFYCLSSYMTDFQYGR